MIKTLKISFDTLCLPSPEVYIKRIQIKTFSDNFEGQTNMNLHLTLRFMKFYKSRQTPRLFLIPLV